MAEVSKKKSNNSLRTSNKLHSPAPIATATTAQAIVTKSDGATSGLERKMSQEILKSQQQKFNLVKKQKLSGTVLHTPEVEPSSKNGDREDDHRENSEELVARKRIRVRKGMRRDSFENAQSSTSTHDSCFDLQEHLNYLIKSKHDINSLVSLPNSLEQTSENQWIYEHLRRITKELNTPWMTLLQENCRCPEMSAKDASFVCVSHSNHRRSKCSALEYSIHNLNSIVDDLNTSSTSSDTQKTILRKLSRIISHIYAHHRDLFLICESETSLASRIASLAKQYNIIPSYILIWDLNDEKDNIDQDQDFKPRQTNSNRQLLDIGPISSEDSDSDSDEYDSDE